MSSFRAAAIQMRSGTNPEANAADLATYVADAAGQGAVYVQTPEMTGSLQRDRKALASVLKSESDDIIVRTASELAAKHGIHLHIGSTAIARDDGKIANRAFLFGPDGNILTRYDKIHMFDVDLDNGESWRESAVYAPGADTVVIDLPFARLGLAICYDVRFPQLFRAQASGRCIGDFSACRLHPADRRSALACAAARACDREWRLHDFGGSGRCA